MFTLSNSNRSERVCVYIYREDYYTRFKIIFKAFTNRLLSSYF